MRPTRPLILATAFAVAVLGAATAGVVAHAGARAKTITVTEKEFHITVSAKKVAPGSVRFVVKNTGKLSHALEIAGPGVKGKRTPLIKPGRSATLAVTLRAGTYTLWCPVPGHAALGMKTSLTVGGSSSGGGAAATTTTGSTSTTSGGGGEAWG